jgi:GT2 family glycosyltransferase
VERAFSEAPDLVALFGSYDAEPPEPGFFSRYMNLRHHFTHQRGRGEASTFWAGCGAVRRSAFLAAGGFDAGRYPLPMIEDIELGLRLAPHGRIRLDPDLQVTHLKRWTLRSVVETDVLRRAVPWAELILESGRLPDDLNLRPRERVSAALAPFVLGAPLAAAALAWAGTPRLALLAALPVAASLWLQRDLLACFARAGGARFALGGWLFHQVHLVYAAATMAACSLRHALRRVGGRR